MGMERSSCGQGRRHPENGKKCPRLLADHGSGKVPNIARASRKMPVRESRVHTLDPDSVPFGMEVACEGHQVVRMPKAVSPGKVAAMRSLREDGF